MIRRSRTLGRPQVVLVVALVLLAAVVLGWAWASVQPFGGITTTTIGECRPGEDPATTLCYRPTGAPE